ncbi:MAG: phosphotransferase [Thermomicrobiales bacterium]
MMDALELNELLDAVGRRAAAPPVRIAGGWSGAGIWRVELEDGPHTLRVFNAGDESDVRRESAVIGHVGAFGLPVATVIASDVVGSHAFQLLRWIDGQEMGRALLGGDFLAAEGGAAFGRLQARLHRVEPPADLAHALDWPVPEAYPERLRAVLLQTTGPGDRLVHLDFHPGNVLVNEGRISGLIDWTNARRGDPRFDLARTYLILRLMPGVRDDVRVMARPILRSFISSWHRAYRTEMGAIRGFRPFLAWAGYGMVYDLGQKPADSMDAMTRQALAATLDLLETRARSWMGSIPGP